MAVNLSPLSLQNLGKPEMIIYHTNIDVAKITIIVMALAKPNTVDVVAYNPEQDYIVLGLLGLVKWGNSGEYLFELITKIKTYIAYALEGHLEEDYPQFSTKTVVIRLYLAYELGSEEKELLHAVQIDYLKPAGIHLEQCVLPRQTQII